MEKKFNELLKFWKNNDGTGKLFNFKFLEYKKGYLKLEAEFGPLTLNPNKRVQGGQMTSMLDDATSILLVLDTEGESYPNSTNLNSLHHRPLHQGKVTIIAWPSPNEFCDPRIQSIKKNIEEIFGVEINNHSLYFYGKKIKN